MFPVMSLCGRLAVDHARQTHPGLALGWQGLLETKAESTAGAALDAVEISTGNLVAHTFLNRCCRRLESLPAWLVGARQHTGDAQEVVVHRVGRSHRIKNDY